MADASHAVVARRWPGGASDRPPFVFVHGAGGDASRFAALGDLIPGSLAIDLPGHGLAGGPALDRIDGPGGYAAVVEALLEREGLAGVILAGHSMGGAIALAVALRGRVRLGGLGLIGTGARLRVHPDFLAAAAAGEAPAPMPGLMFGPEAPPELVAAERAELGSAAASGALDKDLRACDGFDASQGLGSLTLPAAVIVGSADRMTPPRLSEALVRGWGAGGAIVATLVDGAGHYVHRERPEAVAGALRDLRLRVTGEAAR